MNNQNVTVPPSMYQWGRNIGIITSMVALATGLAAQDLPPLPDGGTNQPPPYEPTPEELEAQRQAMEAYWAGNREMFAPYLHDAPAPAPEDLVLKQRLMSAEVAARQRKIEEAAKRDEKVRAWADEQWKLNEAAHEELQKRVPQEVIDTFARQGIRLDFRDGQVVAIKPMDVDAQKTIGAWKAKTNAPIDLASWWECGNSVLRGPTTPSSTTAAYPG